MGDLGTPEEKAASFCYPVFLDIKPTVKVAQRRNTAVRPDMRPRVSGGNQLTS